MIAFLVRSTGVLVFAAAFIALVADGVRSLAADAPVVTPLAATWGAIHPASLAAAEAVVKGFVTSYLWDPVLLTVLGWPTFAVVGGLGILLMLLGRRRGSVPAA